MLKIAIMIIFIWIVFLFYTPAKSQECLTPENVTVTVMSMIPGITVRSLTDSAAVDKLVKIYNTVPPLSSIEADKILIYNSESQKPYISFMVYFSNGCKQAHSSMLTVILNNLIKAGRDA